MQGGAALALALAGDASRAQTLAHDLGKHFPDDTIVQFNYLPTIHAQITLGRDNAKSLEALQTAAPYELGDVGMGRLCPIYIRGLVYLALRQGNEAAGEFQKILDHQGVVLNSRICNLDVPTQYTATLPKHALRIRIS